MRSILSLMLLLSILLTCCARGKKTRFNQAELKWLSIYKQGDTLVFKSDQNQYDTSIIIDVKIFYPDYNPGTVHGKYLPQWGQVWYKNKNLEYHPDGYSLLTMIKKHPTNETYLEIGYLYSTVFILNLNKGSINNYKHGSVYEFDTSNPRSKPYEPKKIIWHENKGIVGYVTQNNISWERVR